MPPHTAWVFLKASAHILIWESRQRTGHRELHATQPCDLWKKVLHTPNKALRVTLKAMLCPIICRHSIIARCRSLPICSDRIAFGTFPVPLFAPGLDYKHCWVRVLRDGVHQHLETISSIQEAVVIKCRQACMWVLDAHAFFIYLLYAVCFTSSNFHVRTCISVAWCQLGCCAHLVM